VESTDDVCSIGSRINHGDRDNDEDVTPNRASIFKGNKGKTNKNKKDNEDLDDEDDAAAGQSVVTFDEDYYQAKVGYGNDTVASCACATYGASTIRDSNNFLDSDTFSRGGATLLTTGTLFPGLRDTNMDPSLAPPSLQVPGKTNGPKARGTGIVEARPGPEDILRRHRVQEAQAEAAAAAMDSTDITICDFTAASDDEASFEDQFLRCASHDTPDTPRSSHKKKLSAVLAPIGRTALQYSSSHEDDDLCASSSSDEEEGLKHGKGLVGLVPSIGSLPVLMQTKTQGTMDAVRSSIDVGLSTLNLEINTGMDEEDDWGDLVVGSPLGRRRQSTNKSNIKSPRTPRLSNRTKDHPGSKHVHLGQFFDYPLSVTIPSRAPLQRSKSENGHNFHQSLATMAGSSGPGSPTLSPQPKRLQHGHTHHISHDCTKAPDMIDYYKKKNSITMGSREDNSSQRDIAALGSSSSLMRLNNKRTRSKSVLGLGVSAGITKPPPPPPSLSWVTSDNLKDVQVLDVQVGPGSLGVVFQDMVPGRSGPPIFCNIKDTSVVANMIFPNDALVRVDEEDCTHMTANDVSKLIHKKQYRSRKFTIVRNHHAIDADTATIEGDSVTETTTVDGIQ
jgi:hypothetical protein